MATLKDVAVESGLAVSTVSRILNNRGYISDDARRRVEEAMKKLHYQPNEVARSLQNKSTNTIGLIVPHIRHPYFAEVISNIENCARKKGYKILLFNSQSVVEREQEYIEMCNSNRVAGIIMCTGGFSLGMFQNLGIPVIALERFVDSGTASVECDNEQGGILATRHLIDQGCKTLLHIGSISTYKMPADARQIGFMKVCKEENVTAYQVSSDMDGFTSLDYFDQIEHALNQYPDVDGIFANSDMVAAYAIQVLAKKGKRVPEDVKIVGFDDVIIATITSPQLTTIHQPIKEMCQMAVDALDNCVNGKMVARRTVLPVSLVKRGSTGL